MRVLASLCVLFLVGAASVQAAPSFFGPSGNIITPDELTAPSPGFNVGYHYFDVDKGELNVVHGNYGLTPNIEVGVSLFDYKKEGSDLSINGKWRALDETPTRPAVALGVIDLAGNAKRVLDKDPSLYVLVSKNLTTFSEKFTSGAVRPLRGTLGLGTGGYDGFFAGLDWTLTPELSVMAEYAKMSDDSLFDDSLFNVGVRWAAGPSLRLDAALIDFDDLALGVSFTKGF